MKDLQRKIDKAFNNFNTKLDASNFGLHIYPRNLKVWDDPELEDEVDIDEEESEEDLEELNFS